MLNNQKVVHSPKHENITTIVIFITFTYIAVGVRHQIIKLTITVRLVFVDMLKRLGVSFM